MSGSFCYGMGDSAPLTCQSVKVFIFGTIFLIQNFFCPFFNFVGYFLSGVSSIGSDSFVFIFLPYVGFRQFISKFIIFYWNEPVPLKLFAYGYPTF